MKLRYASVIIAWFGVVSNIFISCQTTPKVCPSMVISEGGNLEGETADKTFRKDKKKVDKRKKSDPFAFEAGYAYPVKRKNESGLFSKKVMKSWKKY